MPRALQKFNIDRRLDATQVIGAFRGFKGTMDDQLESQGLKTIGSMRLEAISDEPGGPITVAVSWKVVSL